MGRKVKPETIDNYLVALERAFALYQCNQEGVAGKQILRPLKKLYPVDTGFRNLPNGFSGVDLGFQLENIVFVELKQRLCRSDAKCRGGFRRDPKGREGIFAGDHFPS